MKKAIFLDRDGVLNPPVLQEKTNQYSAPWDPQNYVLYPWVIESLKVLIKNEYLLFLVSNQPDYAKGFTTLENLKLVHNKLDSLLKENKILFSEYFYCYHHPKGTIPSYTCICECRKPGNLFLRKAIEKYNLDITNSWMIGDRDVDVKCGQSLQIKTILLKQEFPDGSQGSSIPSYFVENLKKAVSIIERESKIK